VRSKVGISSVDTPTRVGATTTLADAGPAHDAGRQSATIVPSLDSGAPRNTPKDASSAAMPDAGSSLQPQDASVAKDPASDSGQRSMEDARAPDAASTPAPGEEFARCTADVSCNGDLKCYSSGPGYCAEPCQSDSDCTDHEGFDFTCFTLQGACRVDCGPSGTDGLCPSRLVCVADSTGGQRCMLPREPGTGDKHFLEPCDIGHGSGDCVAGLTCYRAGLTAFDGPGYCTQPCMLGSNGMGCDSLMGMTNPGATFICTTRDACALTCSKSMCKPGMGCEEIGQESYCHYPASP
jgi:hypothetical protein